MNFQLAIISVPGNIHFFLAPGYLTDCLGLFIWISRLDKTSFFFPAKLWCLTVSKECLNPKSLQKINKNFVKTSTYVEHLLYVHRNTLIVSFFFFLAGWVGGWIFHKKKTPKTHEIKASFPLETVAWLLHRQGHAVWSSDQLMSEERQFLGSLMKGVSPVKRLSNSLLVAFICKSRRIIEYIHNDQFICECMWLDTLGW